MIGKAAVRPRDGTHNDSINENGLERYAAFLANMLFTVV
jgi:hypothetical protein